MGKQNISTLSLTVKASGAIAQYRAVGFDGAQATVQGQKVQGVSRAAAADGENTTLDCAGTLLIEAGGAFNKGDSLIVDNQGRAIVVTGALTVKAGAVAVTSTAANGAILQGADLPEFVFADALEASGGAGQVVEVMRR